MPMLISLWSVLRGLRFIRPLVWPLSLLLICVSTSWTSCKVSRFLLLPQCPWGRSQFHPPSSRWWVTPEVLPNIERGNICGAVYLDQLTKALDTVDHEILMSKLSSVGVSPPPPPPSLEWFSSYLSNQEQPKTLVRMNYPLLSGFRKEAS